MGAPCRRRVLGLGAVGLLSVGAGCSVFSKPFSDGPELGPITVENSDDVQHVIHLAVTEGSELIYGSSHELEAVSDGIVDGTILVDDAWADRTGEWTIHTRVDNDTSWQHVEVPNSGETDCYSVRLTIEADASVTGFTPDCAAWPPANGTAGD